MTLRDTISYLLLFTYPQSIWPLVPTSLAAVATNSMRSLTNLPWKQPKNLSPYMQITSPPMFPIDVEELNSMEPNWKPLICNPKAHKN